MPGKKEDRMWTEGELHLRTLELLRQTGLYDESNRELADRALRYTRHDDYLCVKICPDHYVLDLCEHGQMVSHRTTRDMDLVLYHIVKEALGIIAEAHAMIPLGENRLYFDQKRYHTLIGNAFAQIGPPWSILYDRCPD